MENWQHYLQEEEYKQQILSYLEENNIVLTEEELEEAMPRWLKKLGAGAALAGALAGVGAAPAHAASAYDSSSPQTHQVDDESDSQINKLVDNGDGTGSVTFEYDGSAGGDIGNILSTAKDKANSMGLTGVGDADLLDANGNPAQDLYEFSDVKFLKFTGKIK